MADSLKFGTSGVRGLAADLVGPAAARYTLAFVAHLRDHGFSGDGLLVARDLRESSAAIAGSVMAAVAEAGWEPLDCGEIPTPALALHGQSLALPAIMVTGSHIPGDRNGLKFYSTEGEITKADEAGILDALESVGEVPSSPVEGTPRPEALEEYLDRCAGLLKPGALDGKRIGVWEHSSVFRTGLPAVLSAFGAECVPLGREEGFKAIDTEAVSPLDAAQIRVWVLENELNALVSTDGDADRPLIADETGTLIRGDEIGVLTARFLAASAVVTPITSNSGIEGAKLFDRVIRTRVGSPFVIAALEGARLSGGTVVGFEANGGVLLGSTMRFNGRELPALRTRDAMLPILGVLGLSAQTGRRLSQLVGSLPARESRSGKLEDVPDEQSQALLDALDEAFFADVGEVAEVSDLDGVRVKFKSGDIVHYRPSGNAPELRCYTEAATGERADELLLWGLATAERFFDRR